MITILLIWFLAIISCGFSMKSIEKQKQNGKSNCLSFKKNLDLWAHQLGNKFSKEIYLILIISLEKYFSIQFDYNLGKF